MNKNKLFKGISRLIGITDADERTLLPISAPPTLSELDRAQTIATLTRMFEHIEQTQSHAQRAGEVQKNALQELATRSEALFQALGSTRQRIDEGVEIVATQQAVIESSVATSAAGVDAVLARYRDIIQGKANETIEAIKVIENLAQELFFVGINASIQAAQAGEAGRAFNVVAEQIRDMAGKTIKSTQGIGKLLDLAPVLNRMAAEEKQSQMQMQQTVADVQQASVHVRATFEHIQSGVGIIGENNTVMADMLEITKDAQQHQRRKGEDNRLIAAQIVASEPSANSLKHLALEHRIRIDKDFDRLTNIRARGVIRISIEPAFVGLSFRLSPNEPLRGLDVEYAQAYADHLGVQCEFVEYPWDRCVELLDMGRTLGEPEADLFWSALMPNAGNERVAYSESYTYLNFVLARRAGDSRINRVADLHGKVLGSTTDSVLLGSLRHKGVCWGGGGSTQTPIKLANLVSYTDQSRIHDCLADGVVDAFLIDEPIYWWACYGQDSPWRGRIEIIDNKMSPQTMYYAVGCSARAENYALLKNVNEFLGTFRDQPQRAEIEQKWKGQITPGSRSYHDEPGELLGENELREIYMRERGGGELVALSENKSRDGVPTAPPLAISLPASSPAREISPRSLR